MKTQSIILISILLSLGAAAQHRVGGYYHGGGVYYHAYSPRIYVSPFSYGLNYYPYYGYPYSYGNPYYGGRREPYKLSLQIESIKVDYRNKIRNARKDKSVSHAQRRENIRNLKAERDQDILSAQRDFRQNRMNYQNSNNNNNSSQDNSDNGTNS